MNAGLFGGSFDPPHRGHLALARAALRELALDRLYVVPARRNPLKDRPALPASRRLAVNRAFFRRLPGCRVSDWELRRPGPSYTEKTLRAFQKRHPRARWFLVMGSDALGDFSRWRNWRAIAASCVLAVGRRPGSPAKAPAGVKAVFLKAAFPRVSSTDIRRRPRYARSS